MRLPLALLVFWTACAPAREGPPNILLVSLDTFRADRVGALGNPDGLTPNLDHFAAESVVFTQAYSQASITMPSHTSLFTSRYPPESAGSTRAANIPADMYTLPQVLGAYGYQTAARVAGADLAPEIGPTKGFDSYVSAVDFGSLYHTVPLALDWLDASDPSRPFFLFVHSYDTHAAYLKPTPFGLVHAQALPVSPRERELLRSTHHVMDGRMHTSVDLLDVVTQKHLRPRSPAARAALAELGDAVRPPLATVSADQEALVHDVYDGAVSYADAWFGTFMARLAERGRLDDTVIVVLADHGEQLGENGLYHRCCSLGDEVSHVPLLVRLPGAEGGGRRVDGLVELVDVLPTLLALVGAEAPAGIRGTSLVPALEGAPFPGRDVAITLGGKGFRMASARSAAGRLTYLGVQSTEPALNDLLATAQLPGPAFEASPGLPIVAQEALRDQLVAWESTLRHPVTDAAIATPPALREALEARGYWDAE
jgi:arylsulfatase A-like enzyme